MSAVSCAVCRGRGADGPYTCLLYTSPFIMGAPNLCVDTPAMWEFSKKMNVPISGKDFTSGQTLMLSLIHISVNRTRAVWYRTSSRWE